MIIVYAIARIITIYHNSLTGISLSLALYSSFCQVSRRVLASRIHLWNQFFDPSYGSKVTNYSQMSYLDTSIWPNCVFSRYFKLCRNRIRHLVRMIIIFKLHYRFIPRFTYNIPYCRYIAGKCRILIRQFLVLEE